MGLLTEKYISFATYIPNSYKNCLLVVYSKITFKIFMMINIKVHLRVRRVFCFRKHFVALNNCANFFALRQTFTVLLDFKVVDLELFWRSALFTTAETWGSMEVWQQIWRRVCDVKGGTIPILLL